MYLPKGSEVTDDKTLWQFIRDNSFGILFSQKNDVPFATHLPFLIDEQAGNHGTLISHMAKANPHWKDINNHNVLIVFQGPHAFISSLWYGEEKVVPTWNYTAVHVYGKFVQIAQRKELKQIILDTLKLHENGSPVLAHRNQAFFDGLLNAVVGFKIEIEKMEGKWKLSQNHSVEQQRKLIAALKSVGDPNSIEIAHLMETNLDT